MNVSSPCSPPRNFSASLSKSSNSRSRIGITCPGTFSTHDRVLERAALLALLLLGDLLEALEDLLSPGSRCGWLHRLESCRLLEVRGRADSASHPHVKNTKTRFGLGDLCSRELGGASPQAGGRPRGRGPHRPAGSISRPRSTHATSPPAMLCGVPSGLRERLGGHRRAVARAAVEDRPSSASGPRPTATSARSARCGPQPGTRPASHSRSSRTSTTCALADRSRTLRLSSLSASHARSYCSAGSVARRGGRRSSGSGGRRDLGTAPSTLERRGGGTNRDRTRRPALSLVDLGALDQERDPHVGAVLVEVLAPDAGRARCRRRGCCAASPGAWSARSSPRRRSTSSSCRPAR